MAANFQGHIEYLILTVSTSLGKNVHFDRSDLCVTYTLLINFGVIDRWTIALFRLMVCRNIGMSSEYCANDFNQLMLKVLSGNF